MPPDLRAALENLSFDDDDEVSAAPSYAAPPPPAVEYLPAAEPVIQFRSMHPCRHRLPPTAGLVCLRVTLPGNGPK